MRHNLLFALVFEVWQAYTARRPPRDGLSMWLMQGEMDQADSTMVKQQTGSQGAMEQTVEKSCWGITLWAVIIVVGLFALGSFVSHSNKTASVGTEVPATVEAASAVSG